MLAVARSLPVVEDAPIEWLGASALEIPPPEAAFDVVLCQQTLQQFPDRPAALGELRRVVAAGWRQACGRSRRPRGPEGPLPGR